MDLVLVVVVAVSCLLAAFRAGRASSRAEALHDALTGLPNRALFTDRVDRALATARREGTRPVVMLLELDRFKEVNDALGHHRGDEVLRQIGPRIASVLRRSDTVARLGGDEFAVLLPGALSAAAGAEVGEKIMAALEEPFHVEGVELEIGASLGIAAFPHHGEDVETLLQAADAAMYAAKGGPKSSELYAKGADVRPDPFALVSELRRAMDEGELAVVYQPKVHLGVADPDRAAEALGALSRVGVGLSIDDFGTGWSSVRGLHHLPVEEIKIDGSLLHDATVVRSTIGLAKSLDLRVVGEGIEDDRTRRRLAALGCDVGQGYLFGPPLDGDAIVRWAEAHVPVAA